PAGGVRVGPRLRAQRELRLRRRHLGPADARGRRHTGRGEPRRQAVPGGGSARLARRALGDGARQLAAAGPGDPLGRGGAARLALPAGPRLMLALQYVRSVPRYALARATRGSGRVATGDFSMLQLGAVEERELPA